MIADCIHCIGCRCSGVRVGMEQGASGELGDEERVHFLVYPRVRWRARGVDGDCIMQ